MGEHVHAIIQAIPDGAITLESIRKEVENDPLLAKLKEILLNDKN